MAQTTANPDGFAAQVAQSDLTVNGTGVSVPPNSEKVVCHVMPSELDAVEELAAEYGLERVDDEMDRRTFAPEN